jgi:hypothetical protein
MALLYPVDEHHGYCPNLCAAAGVASLVTEITAAKISRKCFIVDTIIEEPFFSNSAFVAWFRASRRSAVLGASNEKSRRVFPTALRRLVRPHRSSDLRLQLADMPA